MSAPGKDGASRPLGPDGKPIPGPAEVRQIQAARKMAQQQAQVEEVIGIMHKNVENVLERDRKLGDLEERADALQDGCAQFEKQAAAMKNKFWMENLKAIIAGSVVGLIVLGLLYWKFFMDDHPQGPPPGTFYGNMPQYLIFLVSGYYPPPQAPPAADAGAEAAPADDGGAGNNNILYFKAFQTFFFTNIGQT